MTRTNLSSIENGSTLNNLSVSSSRKKRMSNDSNMDQLCAKLREQAKVDAKKHIYMSNDFTAMKEAYKKNNISPNRELLKSRASGLLTSTGFTNGRYVPFQIMGVKGYTGRINMGLFGACMDIYDGNGEVVLSYSHPPNGGWIPKQTKAEELFERQITDVYYEAYKEAIHEQKVAEKAGVSASVQSTSISVTVETSVTGFDMKA